MAHYIFGALPQTSRPHILLTMLRHPLPRVLSCYQWIKNKSDRAGEAPRFSSLQDFVLQSQGKLHSQIVQFGAGFGSDGPAKRRSLSTRELFERSVEELDRNFQFVGIAEHFEETLFLFAHICGIKSLPGWKCDNRNPGRILADDVSTRERELIEDVFRYDFELYFWALRRFHKKVQETDFGPGLSQYKIDCENQYKDRLIVQNREI